MDGVYIQKDTAEIIVQAFGDIGHFTKKHVHPKWCKKSNIKIWNLCRFFKGNIHQQLKLRLITCKGDILISRSQRSVLMEGKPQMLGT